MAEAALAHAGRAGLDAQLAAALEARFGERFSTARQVCIQHGTDEFRHDPVPPDGVVFALSAQDVVDAVNLCRTHNTALIAYGTGTSVEGHICAVHGGISLNLQGMNQVLRVNPSDMDCTVQPGVTRMQLNDYLRSDGLFFPIDPGANASIGGMTATCASGTNAVRYGTMKENVLCLTVVLPDGSVIKTGGRARKSSSGYDLTRLFVGSEGTLGVITEITLRLYGIPEAMSAAVCPFRSVDDAVNTAMAIIHSGIPVARMELMDTILMGAVNAYSKMDHPVAPTLFLEFHGTTAGVEEQARMVAELASDYGGTEFRWATSTEQRNALWKARHDAYYAALALRPGCRGWGTDVCVPISRLAECIEETARDLAALPMPCPIFGHVGDGNFHILFIVDLKDPLEMALVEAANTRLIERALAMEGTCTGEHGIGLGKVKYLRAEHGDAVDLMRRIKGLIDPGNVMNPGKVLEA
jgi:D-lactate dehydrogenase (cytochrome)